jgi:hypothetical protein
MPTIAFVTCEARSNLTQEDRQVCDILRDYGITTSAAVWNGVDVHWQAFDAVIIRTCWDYHLHPAEFAAWLARLEQCGVPLWNPAPLVRWNMDKTYLRDLQQSGLPIVPTVWLNREDHVNLAQLLCEQGWAQAVVKPAIAATAFETWRTNTIQATSDQARLDSMLARGGVLVQPFVEQICDEGEWSFIFIDGTYSHAVLKRPAPGDFRSQDDFGGSVLVTPPAPALIAQAERVVAHICGLWLYARVDGIVAEGTFLLMELELIEPFLFLTSNVQAAERFAQAIHAFVRM